MISHLRRCFHHLTVLRRNLQRLIEYAFSVNVDQQVLIGSRIQQNQSTRSQAGEFNFDSKNNNRSDDTIHFKSEPPNDSTADAQPLAPPPRPFPNNTSDLSDRATRNKNHFNLEPNPFEQSFGNQSGGGGDTQNKELLPSVASLTSPSSLLPGGTPGWSNSLRSGPLSPAMLAGPAGGDYFSDSHFRTGFPTPNESSLRTGLTPGGGGSMFPAPSPNTQAFINSLQGNGNGTGAGNAAAATGGTTPNTVDFHRTALSAAAAAAAAAASTKPPAFNLRRSAPMGSRASETSGLAGNNDQKPFQTSGVSRPSNTASPHDPFAQHDTDAANGLYMLANANGSRNNSQFSVVNRPTAHAVNASAAGTSEEDGRASGGTENIMNGQSPVRNRRNTKNSVVSMSESVNGNSEPGDYSGSDRSEQAKPDPVRSRSKKASHSKTTSNATTSSNVTGDISSTFNATRRKGEDINSKAPPIKRSRKSSGSNINNKFTTTAAAAASDNMIGDMDESEDEDDSMMDTRQELGNRKMTDEEKRKNFLERNR